MSPNRAKLSTSLVSAKDNNDVAELWEKYEDLRTFPTDGWQAAEILLSHPLQHNF